MNHIQTKIYLIVNSLDSLIVRFSRGNRVDIGNGKKKINLVKVELSKQDFLDKVGQLRQRVSGTYQNGKQTSSQKRLKEILPDSHVKA